METGLIVEDVLDRDASYDGVFHVMNKGANLAIGLVAVGGVAASKVRR